MNIGTIMELLSKRKHLQAHESWSPSQLEAYQSQALRRVREYAYAHSPFYQQFHKGLYEAPLQELPVLTKAMVMEHFDDLVTDRTVRLRDVKTYLDNRQGDERFLGRYWVNATSGSTGRPGLFLASREEWLTMLASALRVFGWAGIQLKLTHRTKVAQITTTNPSLMTAQGGQSMGNWWMPMLLMAAGEPVPSIVKRLNGWQPEVVIAYASMLRILADEQLSGRLRIAPRSVLSGSEVLTQETRRRIVRAWGNVLFNEYGYSEGGALGAECNQHRGMHLQEDLVIAEVVDRNNQPVPTGVYGEKLLVTILGNRTQPLIRYEMDDSLRLSSELCPCGRPFSLIEDIQGRTWDILSFPGVAGDSVNVHPIVFYGIMDRLPVSRWQVVQESDGLHILVSGVHGDLDENGLADAIRQTLTKQGAIIPSLEIHHVENIPQTPSGKAPLVKSNLSRSSEGTT